MANTEHEPTLAEAADAFLSHLPPEERGKVQAEISRFARWLGSTRRVKDVSPVDVESYGEYIVPSAVKPLRSFLTYTWKKGAGNMNLAPHLRVKKTARKTVVSRQSDQVRAVLTAQGYAKLEQELHKLKKQRSRVLEEMQIAAADKDFRENAPLTAARERKAHLDGRIKEIEAVLKEAKIAGGERDTSGARSGDTVVLRDLSSGKEFTYTLSTLERRIPLWASFPLPPPGARQSWTKKRGRRWRLSLPPAPCVAPLRASRGRVRRGALNGSRATHRPPSRQGPIPEVCPFTFYMA